MRMLGILLLSLGSLQVFSADLSETTQVGSLTFVQSMVIDGDFKRSGKEAPWFWGLTYTYTKITDTSQSSPVVDETNEINGTMGWTGKGNWGADGGLAWATTPAEGLTTAAANFNLSYNHNLTEDEYGPSLKTVFSISRRNYLEIFNGTIPTRTGSRPLSGSNGIDQSGVGIGLKWVQSLDWIFSGSYTYFFYGRNVSDFLKLLDSPRAAQIGFGGFSGSVGSLALYSISLTENYFLNDDVDFTLTEGFSLLAADLSASYAARLMAGYAFLKSYKVSVGADYTSSSTFTDTSGVLTLEGHF